jgi:phosphate transport system permease protein
MTNPIQSMSATAPKTPPPRQRSARWDDRFFELLTKFFAFLVFSILAAILIALFVGSSLTLEKYGTHFLFSSNWDPVQEEFGALVPIYGTLVTSLVAMVIGVPISFGIALFLTELAPGWLNRPLGTAIELLAGMWGLFVLVPIFQTHIQPIIIKLLAGVPFVGALFQGPPLGIGMLTAGVILSIMVIPFIASVMRDVFELVPAVLKETAYGLGATTWEVMWKVVLPYTKAGVIGGVMLGLGRALGETMAVTFVIGNANRLAVSLMAPGNSIASALANEFTEAVGDLYTSALMELGLILFLITTIVLALAKLLLQRLARSEGSRT